MQGPDLVFEAPASELAADSWEGARLEENPRKGKIVVPGGEGWNDFYVRTALVRPSSWKPGLRGPVVRKASKIVEILQGLGYYDHERLITLALDKDDRLLAIHEASVGGLGASAILPRDVLRMPVLVGAKSFILAHNHPSGDPRPSDADFQITQALMAGGSVIGLELVEHLVIVRGRRYSSVMELLDMPKHPVFGSRKYREGRAGGVADEVLQRSSAELALEPYGKWEKFVVRTAMLEAEGERPAVPLRGYEDVIAVPAVRALRELTSPAVLVLCADNALNLLATHVRVGDGDAMLARDVFAVAATVPTGGVVVVHNHPSRIEPLLADRQLASEIGASLALIGVRQFENLVAYSGLYQSVLTEQ